MLPAVVELQYPDTEELNKNRVERRTWIRDELTKLLKMPISMDSAKALPMVLRGGGGELRGGRRDPQPGHRASRASTSTGLANTMFTAPTPIPTTP